MTAFLRLFTSTTVTKVNPQSFNSVLAQPCVFIAIPTEDKKAKRATLMVGIIALKCRTAHNQLPTIISKWEVYNYNGLRLNYNFTYNRS